MNAIIFCDCKNLHTKATPLIQLQHLLTRESIQIDYYCCVGDVDLLNSIETMMEGNKQEGGGVAVKALLDYPLLLSKVETF